MDVTILLEVQVKPEKVGALKATLKEMLVDTRAFDGCIGVQAIQDLENPGNIVLVQKWKSRGHYEKYNAWRAKTGAASAAAEKLAATFGLRYFDSVDV
jgi:quinol monooxygenase YgiN